MNFHSLSEHNMTTSSDNLIDRPLPFRWHMLSSADIALQDR